MTTITFSTKIKRSTLFAAVTVRKWMGVSEKDYIGLLSQTTAVSGEVVFIRNEPGDIWMKLTNTKYAGGWIALSYNGKVFVDDLPLDPDLPAPPVRFARVRHCIQSPVTGYRRYMDWRGFTGKGDPSVFKGIATKTTKPIFLTKALQQWIFSQIVLSAEGHMTLQQMEKVWENLTAWNKAFTNKGGREQGYADYILHVNENARQGLRAENIMGTGATLKLAGREYKLYGEWVQDYYVADVLDPGTLLTNFKDDFWLFYAAPNSVNIGPIDERIDPFPKMYNDWDTYWPLMGYGVKTQTIKRDWLEVLDFEVVKGMYPYMPWRARGGAVDDRWDLRLVK